MPKKPESEGQDWRQRSLKVKDKTDAEEALRRSNLIKVEIERLSSDAVKIPAKGPKECLIDWQIHER